MGVSTSDTAGPKPAVQTKAGPEPTAQTGPKHPALNTLGLRPLTSGPTASGWIVGLTVGVLLGVGIGVLLSAIAGRPGAPTAVPPAAPKPVPAAPGQSLAEQLSADVERALPAGWVLGAPDALPSFRQNASARLRTLGSRSPTARHASNQGSGGSRPGG